jgi:hypothetical protein
MAVFRKRRSSWASSANSMAFGNSRIALAGFSLVLVFAILLSGLAIQGGTNMVIAYAALIVSPAVLMLSSRASIALLVAFSFVVSGLLFYFARISLANWIPYLLSAALGVRLMANQIAVSGVADRNARLRGTPPFAKGILLFLSLVALSALLNDTPVNFDVLALKHFVLLWIPMLLVWRDRQFENHWMFLWEIFFVVAVLQLPFSCMQRIHPFAIPKTGFNWDSVVGTFGGDPDGGGASGAMGLFLVFSTLLAGSLWRVGSIKGRMVAFVTLSSVTVIGLAEVKSAILLFPAAFAYLFRDQLAERPFAFLAKAAVVGVVLLIVLYVYYLMYVSEGAIDLGFVDTLLPRFLNFFDPRFVNPLTGEVGRIPALILWWNGNSGDPYALLFGHGPMAVRVSTVFGVGDILRASRLNLGMFSLPVFLWEFGLLGTIAYGLSLFSGMLTAFHLSKDRKIPLEHRAALSAEAFGIFMILIFMPYNRDLIDVPAIPLLLALLLGHCSYWWYRTRPVLGRNPTFDETYSS